MTTNLDVDLNTGWENQALCAQVDPEIFFPEKGQQGTDAKAICATCPVQTECLTDALTNPADLYGIRAGHSRADLLRLRKQLGITRACATCTKPTPTPYRHRCDPCEARYQKIVRREYSERYRERDRERETA